MERTDLMTEITSTSTPFKRKDLVEKLDLNTKRRANKLWAVLRNRGVIGKKGNSFFVTTTTTAEENQAKIA